MAQRERSRTPARPTFVLGVGAQKAGTTWLSRYLQASPEFQRGYRKEYHVFDSLDLPSEDWMRRRLVRLARDSVEAVGHHEPGDAEVLHRLAMLVDLDFYYDYFKALVSRDDPVRATGDLTPDYAMLSAARMTSIRESFAERGLRTAAVFLMRDPVERVWSHIRMKAHRHPGWYARSSEEELAAEYADPRYVRRTRYEQTLAALTEAFDGADVHVGLYENLFVDDVQVRAISRLVGIAERPPRLQHRSNESPRAVERLSDDVTRTVAQHYAETYREVGRRCPELDIARWWPHAHWVL